MKAGLDRLAAAADGLAGLEPDYARVLRSSAQLRLRIRRRSLVPEVLMPVARPAAPARDTPSVAQVPGVESVSVLRPVAAREGAFERWRSRRRLLTVALPLAIVLSLSLTGDAGRFMPG